jgi:hypothetical protein
MRLSRSPLLLAVLLFAAAPALRADDTKEFLDPKNWEGNTDLFKIEGTTIIGETTKDPGFNTFFCTKEKYGDFELTCKVKLTDGVGNSGFQIRSKLVDPKKFVVHGPQADIGKGYWGSLYGEGVGGMIKASDPKVIAKAVKEKDVNEYQITAKGSKITIKINGETMVDGDFPKLPGKDAKDFPAEGIIALQVHAGYPKMKIEVSDIKFTKLK